MGHNFVLSFFFFNLILLMVLLICTLIKNKIENKKKNSQIPQYLFVTNNNMISSMHTCCHMRQTYFCCEQGRYIMKTYIQ